MMKKVLYSVTVALIFVLLSACGVEEAVKVQVEAPPAEEKAKSEILEPSPKSPSTTDAVAPETVSEASPEASPVKGDLHDQLSGSSWKIGDFQVSFLDKEKVLLKGGVLINIMPKGLEAPYQYEDGAIVISALGQRKTLVWDGEKLLMDGMAASRVQ